MENRRKFLKKLGITAGGISTIGGLSPIFANTKEQLVTNKPIKINGRVTTNGKGVANVQVTDGQQIVLTDQNGNFNFLSNNNRKFVYITQPAGYKINQLDNGSADFFKPIDATKKNNEFLFQLTPSVVSDNEHHFLLLADPQIQSKYEAQQLLDVATPDFINTVKDINHPNTFGIGCGDLVFDKLELFKDYNQSIKNTNVPFYQVIGNHDMDLNVRSDKMTTTTFESLFGPTYYSFNRGEIHYVVLDDVFFIGQDKKYIGYINEEQLAWLEQDLSFVEPGTTVVVSLHIPTYTGAVRRYPERDVMGGVASNRAYLYKILEPYNTHLMSGHTHFNDNMVAKNRFEHCHGTVCGAWWSGPICWDGTPSGYGVYSAKGSDFKWYYKSIGHDKNYQFTVYKKGEHPDHKDKWCLNVWNWDPEWQICWYEDGIKKTDVSKIMALDPLSIKLHTGPKLPKRRSWVEPQLNDHMFFFTPNEKAKTITVEVTDRFGNKYSQTV